MMGSSITNGFRKSWLCTAWLVGLVVGLPACGRWRSDPTETGEDGKKPPARALSIGDVDVSVEQLDAMFVSRVGELADQREIDLVKSRLLDDFIDEELLDRQARKLGVHPNETDVRLFLQQAENDRAKDLTGDSQKDSAHEEAVRLLRIQMYIRDHVSADFSAAPEQIQEYYRAHIDDFKVPEMVHVHEILVNSADQAERILSLLKTAKNKNFSQLAQLYSVAPSAANGGDMGWFARGDLPEEMEKVFYNSLTPGRLSPIIQTRYGYHVFLLEERNRPQRPSLEGVRERITDLLFEEYQKRALEERLVKLRRETPIRLYRENLGFSYNGSYNPGGSLP